MHADRQSICNIESKLLTDETETSDNVEPVVCISLDPELRVWDKRLPLVQEVCVGHVRHLFPLARFRATQLHPGHWIPAVK